MKQTHRWLAALLAMIMILSLCACGNKKTDDKGTTKSSISAVNSGLDLQELETWIAWAADLSPAEFSEGSWEVLENALRAARQARRAKTQEAVDSALKNLQQAVDALQTPDGEPATLTPPTKATIGTTSTAPTDASASTSTSTSASGSSTGEETSGTTTASTTTTNTTSRTNTTTTRTTARTTTKTTINKVKVPNVAGYTKAEATKALTDLGFKVSVNEQYHSTVANGKVISQTPVSGTEHQKGITITITVSKGKQPVTVTFNANGGSVSSGTKTVYLSSTYGNLPTPTKDYCRFLGWYTSASGGSKVSSTTTVSNASNHTLYARWQANSPSDWVLASQVPAGARIVSQKWTYTLTETTTSTSSSLSGWTQTGSSWKQVASGTHYYASYPGGFDQGDTLYSKYNKSALTSYTNTNTKREVSSASRYSYIYWHWNAVLGEPCKPYNRQISTVKGGSTGSGKATHFAAFESTTSYGHTDSNGTTANEYFCNRGNYTDVSWWWFRFEVYKQTYVDYQKIYSFKKTSQRESTTEVKASSTISNVQKWVQYQAK